MNDHLKIFHSFDINAEVLWQTTRMSSTDESCWNL